MTNVLIKNFCFVYEFFKHKLMFVMFYEISIFRHHFTNYLAMNKSIKSTSLFLLIITFVIATSCLQDIEEQRAEEKEKAEISNFLLNLINNDIDVDSTASGLYYIVNKAGTGVYPQNGDTCYVEYVGYFMNGAAFDASVYHSQDAKWKVIYKETIVIQGFEEAVGLMKSGEEAKFIIPSKLAYGSIGYGIIPPYTTLIFDLKMHEIKPNLGTE